MARVKARIRLRLETVMSSCAYLIRGHQVHVCNLACSSSSNTEGGCWVAAG